MLIANKDHTDPAVLPLVEHYGFQEVHVERVLSGGMFAQPVVIRTDRGRFVQRLHRFRNTEPGFRFQAEVTNAAWERGVRCPRVEPTVNGKWCIHAKEGVIAIHEYVEGTCDSWQAWQVRKRQQDGFLHDLGRLIAQLHNSLHEIKPSGDSRLDYRLPPIQFGRLERIRDAWQQRICEFKSSNTGDCSEARDQLLSLEDRIERHWDALTSQFAGRSLEDLRGQIVHGDISPVNIVVGPTGQMTLIDWDCVHVGHRIYDALGDVLNRPPHHPEQPISFCRSEVTEYLAGYESMIAEPLTAEERRLIPAFCLARQLEDLRQRLQVIPDLDAAQDATYARLIQMRVEMMDQIELN